MTNPTPNASPAVRSAARLAAVQRSGLLDTDPEEPFDALARLAAELLETPFAFVTVVDDERSFWKSCVGTATGPGSPRQNAVEESFCQYVVDRDEALLLPDAREDPLTWSNPSIESMGVVAWAGYPIRAPGGEVLGTFCVVDTRVRSWSERDARVLRGLAQAATTEVGLRMALGDAREAESDSRRCAREAEVLAATLQQSLLPPALPVLPGWDVAARYRAGGRGVEVLGDFYDVVPSVPGIWAAFLGDVCGKGAPAARTTALARYTLRAAAHLSADPRAVLLALNEALLDWFDHDSATSFVTAVHAVLRDGEDGTRRVDVCLGGHEAPLVRRADGRTEDLGVHGPLLGVFPDVGRLQVRSTELRPGDCLVLFTDGLSEARQPGGSELGREGVRAVLAASSGDAAAVAAVLEDAALRHSGGSVQDDTAVLVLRCLA